MSIATGSFDEQARVRVDGVDYDSYRGQLRSFLALGLAHPVARWRFDRAWVDGHASVGLGPTFHTGHWQLPLREDATFAYVATEWLTLRAGVGLGVDVDATAARRSFVDAGLPLSLALGRAVEIVYRPMLSVPLGDESSAVFGGSRKLGTRMTVLPFELTLRFRMEAIGW